MEEKRKLYRKQEDTNPYDASKGGAVSLKKYTPKTGYQKRRFCKEEDRNAYDLNKAGPGKNIATLLW